MSAFGTIYRVLLKILGGLHIFVGLGFLLFMVGTGPYRFGYLGAASLVLVGLVLASRKLSPRFITHPRGMLGGLTALTAVVVLAGTSLTGGGYIGGLLQARGMASGIAYGLVPGSAIFLLCGSFVLPILILLVSRSSARADQGTGRRFGAKYAQMRAVDAIAPRDTGPVLALRGVDWLARLATGGVIAGAAGAALHLWLTDRSVHDAVLLAGPRALVLYGLGIGAGAAYANPIRLKGDTLIRPRSRNQALSARGLAIAPLVLLAGLGLERLVPLGYYPEIAPFLPLVGPVTKGMAGLAVAFGIAIAMTGPPLAELIAATEAAEEGARPEPARPAAAALPELRPAAASTSRLPAIGAAMKLYVAADWLILRLMGLGLVGTAWMLWQMIAAGGPADDIAALSYGQAPMTAVYVYGALGAVLTLPYLLPGRISAPSHVGWGLAKAVLLVAAALFLIPPLGVAIVTFTDDIYHATLLTTVPVLFKAIAGVAITSILLISFFKQLNKLPKTDYKGEPVTTVSQADLRSMRLARMGQA